LRVGALSFLLTVTDLNGQQSTDTCLVNVISANSPPVADAGADQSVNEGVSVILDGSGSTDSNSGVLSYLWQQIDGPAVTLSDPTSPRPGFAAPQVSSGAGSLSFRLIVTNRYGLKSSDICFVNVTWANAAPEAVAGLDQTAMAGSVATLDGSSSVAWGSGIVSYRWHQTHGKPVTLSDPASVTPYFTTKNAGPYGNPLAFRLTVEDGDGLRSRATQVINVQ
jgi:hypothetical protein